MPVKLGSKLPAENEARIEIIPLIDIMFFLLAAFMLVSLSMVQLQGVPITLPTATTGSTDSQRDLLRITVDRKGLAYLDTRPIGAHELTAMLRAAARTNANVRVFISGDEQAAHGDVIQVLDAVRGAGIQKVAFEIQRPASSQARP